MISIILLAAGNNSRFFPLNSVFTKSATELLGSPLIIKTLQNLVTHGYREVIVVVPSEAGAHELGELVSQNQVDISITPVIQSQAKGMGDALLQVYKQLGHQVTDRFLLSLGYYTELGSMIDAALSSGFDQVVAGSHTNQPELYGVLKIKDDQVVGIVEKPAPGTEPSNIKTNVVHLLSSDFLAFLSEAPESEYNYELALNDWMSQTKVGLIQLESEPSSLKYPWHLLDIMSDLLGKSSTFIDETAQIADTAVIDDSTGPVIISAGAVISHATRIVGPCYIGQDVTIGDHCLIRGSSLEQAVEVGAFTEVARSALLTGATLHFGYVADSVIGRNVKIGAGLTVANKRLDRQPIKVQVKSKLVNTQRTALGVMIGDNAQIGIRVSTMPGTVVAPEIEIAPGQVIRHTILEPIPSSK